MALSCARKSNRAALRLETLEARDVPAGFLTSTASYLTPTAPGVEFTPLVTVGDSVNGYRMVGIPDGMGAFDNRDGTFTILMNHELPTNTGIARAHGGTGAFVSKWVVSKSDLSVLSGADLIDTVFLFDRTTGEYVQTSGVQFSRFC